MYSTEPVPNFVRHMRQSHFGLLTDRQPVRLLLEHFDLDPNRGRVRQRHQLGLRHDVHAFANVQRRNDAILSGIYGGQLANAPFLFQLLNLILRYAQRQQPVAGGYFQQRDTAAQRLQILLLRIAQIGRIDLHQQIALAHPFAQGAHFQTLHPTVGA
ncbi:MAG: hypothetical protein R3F44_08220 [Candidatus Competibacteraceae bacterium]